MEEEHDGLTAKVKFDHYEKRRKLKMKFIHDFMQSLKKKSRQGAGGAHGGAALVSLSLLPKENVVEFKRSRCKLYFHERFSFSVCESAISIRNPSIAGCNGISDDRCILTAIKIWGKHAPAKSECEGWWRQHSACNLNE
jgi:hypothetical protein